MMVESLPMHTLEGEQALLRVHMACLAEQAQRHPTLVGAYQVLQASYARLVILLACEEALHG